MNLLLLIAAIAIVVSFVIWQIKVCRKYLFEFAGTKIDEKKQNITIKKEVIPFSEIEYVRIRDVEINVLERYFVSIMFFNGVSKMDITLKNGKTKSVILPSNYISDFADKLETNGVTLEY